MTLEQIKKAPKGTYFAFINTTSKSLLKGEYIANIMRKTEFIHRKFSSGKEEYKLKYEGIRCSVIRDTAMISREFPGIFREGNMPLTAESAEKYYSQKSKDFTKVKQMIIKAPFLPNIESVEFRL